MKRIVTSTLITLLLVIGTAKADTIQSCHDGDTCRTVDGTRIRLHGIDAPELDQPYGYQSRNHLNALVSGKDVSLSCSGRSYKRRVCGMTLDGQDIEAEMVEAGLAWDYARYSRGQYQAAQDEAQKDHRGLWADTNPTPPWTWRRRKR